MAKKYQGVTQEPNGTWTAYLSRGSGTARRQWRERNFDSAEAAAEARAKVVLAMGDGSYVAPSALTVGKYLGDWLDERAVAGLRPSTIASYRGLVRKWIVPHLGHVKLQELDPHHIDRLYATMANHVSLRTVRFAHAVTRKALADAVRKGVLRANAADRATPPKTSATRAPEHAMWAPEELRAFLEQSAGHYHHAFWHLAGFTGLRRGELCGLRWGDVDLEAGALVVRRTLTSVDSQPVWGDVKTGRSRRRVALDPATVAVLRRHKSTQLSQRVLLGAGWTDSGCVFTAVDGKPLHPDSAGQAFERAVKRSGLPRLGLHGLRHSHCTHLLVAGVDVKTVSARLGHASAGFTLDHYGHVIPGSQEAAAAAVARLVGG